VSCGTKDTRQVDIETDTRRAEQSVKNSGFAATNVMLAALQ
jgi:hypothetical protein